MFNITIGDKTREFMKLLDIESFPFTESEVKSKFRKQIKNCHSDKVKGNDFLTRKIIEAYSHIKHLAINGDEAAKKGKDMLEAEQESEDMFDLFDTCKECNGTGKKIIHHRAYIDICKRCNQYSRLDLGFFSTFLDNGTIRVKCRDCHGTGKFKQRNGRIVNCRECKGKGWLIITCPKCKGKGVVFIKANITENICLVCGGSGRIKLDPFNPVIPKGAIL